MTVFNYLFSMVDSAIGFLTAFLETDIPSTIMSPEEAGNMPAIIFSKVVLPEP